MNCNKPKIPIFNVFTILVRKSLMVPWTYSCSLDNESPVFTPCPANQSITLAAGQSTAIATWEPATATDNSGIIPTITCTKTAGITLGIGTTEITCSAVDQYENTEVCYFVVEIKGEYWLTIHTLINMYEFE